MSDVAIYYRRLPDRDTVFRQPLVHRTPECIITFMPRTPLPAPIMAGETVMLEPQAPAIWFTFPEMWHDIGRFHTASRRFTGYYANILTPVEFRSELEWETTDLFLDVWLGADGSVQLLDEDELESGARAGAISAELAAAARREAERVLRLVAEGAWPPQIVREWTLERVSGHTS